MQLCGHVFTLLWDDFVQIAFPRFNVFKLADKIVVDEAMIYVYIGKLLDKS